MLASSSKILSFDKILFLSTDYHKISSFFDIRNVFLPILDSRLKGISKYNDVYKYGVAERSFHKQRSLLHDSTIIHTQSMIFREGRDGEIVFKRKI